MAVKKQPMGTAPKDGSKVDLYIEIYASPRSFGMGDSFWVPHCWWDGESFVHMHRGKPAGLDPEHINGWAPDGTQETDYRD